MPHAIARGRYHGRMQFRTSVLRRATTALLLACIVLTTGSRAAHAERIGFVVPPPVRTTALRSGPVLLPLDVYRPTVPLAVRRPPAVILVHGGAWVSGSRRSAATIEVARRLAARGFVVMAIEYRLSCGRGEYSDLSAPVPELCGYGIEDAVTDVQNATSHVLQRQRTFGFDPTRVSLVGLSAGGHLSLLAALRDPSRLHVRHVVNLSGQASTDLVPSMSTDGRFAIPRSLGGAIGCTWDACPDLWAAANPAQALLVGETYPFDVLMIAGSGEPSAVVASWGPWQVANAQVGVPTRYAGVASTCHADACLDERLSPRTKRTAFSLFIETLRS